MIKWKNRSVTDWLTDWLVDLMTEWVIGWVGEWVSEWVRGWVGRFLESEWVKEGAWVSEWVNEGLSELFSKWGNEGGTKGGRETSYFEIGTTCIIIHWTWKYCSLKISTLNCCNVSNNQHGLNIWNHNLRKILLKIKVVHLNTNRTYNI